MSVNHDFTFSMVILKIAEVLLIPMNHLPHQNYSNCIMICDYYSLLWAIECESSSNTEQVIVIVDIIISSSILLPILDTKILVLTFHPFVLTFYPHAATTGFLLSGTSSPIVDSGDTGERSGLF